MQKTAKRKVCSCKSAIFHLSCLPITYSSLYKPKNSLLIACKTTSVTALRSKGQCKPGFAELTVDYSEANTIVCYKQCLQCA